MEDEGAVTSGFVSFSLYPQQCSFRSLLSLRNLVQILVLYSQKIGLGSVRAPGEKQ